MITIKNYTSEDLEYIKNNYFNMSVSELSKQLNKSENSIYNAIRKLGLKKQVHNKWTKEEIDFLKDNFQRMTHLEMGKILKKTEYAICAKCSDLNLYKKEVPWSDEEISFVKNNYMEMVTADISKILNRTTNAIELKASRLGLKKYPYTCDYHYFETINTEEKAYWLGFLSANGWISKNDKSNAGVIGIELQYNDITHLKKFNKSIKGNYRITDTWKACLISTKDKEKKHHLCCIRIFSLTMYNTLANLGFTNNKSYDFHIPSIDNNLLRHYIRGYFDGDGRLCCTNKSFKVSFITASENMNNDLINTFNSLCIKIYTNSFISEYGTQLYQIEINKNSDKIKFLDYLYKDSNIYLDRKYKKYLKAKIKYNT